MSKFKKFFTILVAIAMVVTIAPVGSAQTVDLQAQIASLLAQIQALQTQLAGQASVPAAYSFASNLTIGSKGADVTALQTILVSKGHLTMPAGVAMGYFGPLTQAALGKYQAAVGISPTAGYFGPRTRAYVNSLAAAPVTPVTPVAPVVTPLSVTVAVGTPVAGNVLMGEANRVVSQINFAASADADTNITALVVRSLGTARLAAQDIASVKVFDGTKQIGLTQTMVDGRATFTFAPAILISKGTVKTLGIAVDIVTTAQAMATVKMGVESSADVSGAAFTGVFPVVGNTFNILPGGSLGTLTVSVGPVIPVTTGRIGDKDVILGNFVVSAGTEENLDVTQFNVGYLTTGITAILDSDVVNIRVKVGGVLQGTSANFANRRATIDFPTPVRINKGETKTFQVIGDIAAGVARNIELRAEVSSVFARGVTSGAGLGGPATAFNLTITNRIAIDKGLLSVMVSTASPSGGAATIVKSTMAQTLGVYDVRAIGESVLVNTVNLVFLAATGATEIGTITSVGLYNEAGGLLSNFVSLPADDGNNRWGLASNSFTLNWTVPANTTQRLHVRGVTSGITGPTPSATVRVQLVNTGSPSVAIISTGLSSSGLEGPNNITLASTLALPPISVNQMGTFANVGDIVTTPFNQNVLGPTSQVITGTLRITASNEDQRLRTVVLTGVVTPSGNVAGLLSSVALFDGLTQVTNFIAPVTDVVTFAAADILVPTTFTNNTPKTLNIVANVISPVPVEASTLRWTLATAGSQLEMIGVISGTVAQKASGVVDLRVNASAFNAGGLYTFRSNVLEVKIAADSPSGTIARGTFTSVARFDLESKGANQNLGVDTLVFTSTVGLPPALISSVTATGVLNSATLFRLFDRDGGIPIATTRFLNVADGTIRFSGIPDGALTVTFGQVRKISLQITTTDQGLWPTNASMQWAVRTAASAVVGSVGTLLLTGNSDIGTVVALQTGTTVGVAGVSGGLKRTGTVSNAFIPGTDAAYIDHVSAATVVSAGNIRIAIGGTAGTGLGFTVGSIVVTGDADVGTTIGLPTGSVLNPRKTNAAGSITTFGVDGAYLRTTDAALAAGDTRLSLGNTLITGLNWQGGVGFGGATYSIPANAPTVTIQ